MTTEPRRQVVVVGGGVVGCATAFRLARDGCAVTLVERDMIASHASRFNAGNLNPLHGTPSALIPFALEAFRLHAEARTALAALGCGNYDIRPVRRVHLGLCDDDLPDLAATAALFASISGFSATWLDQLQLRRLDGRLSNEIRYGVMTEGNLSVDSHAFTQALAAGAVALGARIVHHMMTGISSADNRVTAIRTTGGTIRCDDLVLASGPWMSDMNDWFGVDLAVTPVKGELLLMRLPAGAPEYDFTRGTACLYRRGDDEVWIGTTTENDGYNVTPTDRARLALLEGAMRIMPEIDKATMVAHVAALRPTTPSNSPIAGKMVGWQNVLVANGGGAKGVLLSAGIAQRISQCLSNDGQAVDLEKRVT